MSVIVRASYNEAKKYRNKTVHTTVNGKKHNVYFKVVCDDLDLEDCIELAKSSSNVIMLDYQGIEGKEVPDGVYVGKTFDWGSNITESDVENIVKNETPRGMTPIIKLPDSFNDLEFVWRMSQKYGKVRFCGGHMFCATGCNLGCCGVDIMDKHNIKHSDNNLIKTGCCCAFDVLDDTDLELEVGAVKQQASKKKPKLSFNDLLFRNGKVDL